ncbi:MAG: ribosome maturation factor RimP [Nitriliruptoraceae bacterium]
MAETDDLSATVRDLAAPIASRLGLELLDVVVKGPRGRRLVRLTADLADPDAEGEVDVDTIAALSRELESVLDDADPIPGRYTLEVSSPGIDRPLSSPRDFRRNLGRDVRVDRLVEPDSREQATGTLISVSDDSLTLDIGDSELVVALDEVERAHVVLPW